MNTSRRVLIASVFVALATIATSATITQQFSFQLEGGYQGTHPMPTIGRHWTAERFDPQMGLLQSVAFTASLTQQITVTEGHPYGQRGPIDWTPTVSLVAQIRLYTAGTFVDSDAATGEPRPIAPYGYSTYAETLEAGWDLLLTEAYQLGAFQVETPVKTQVGTYDGIPLHFQSVYFGSQGHGYVNTQATFTGTLTYEFEPAPEQATEIFARMKTVDVPDQGQWAGALALVCLVALGRWSKAYGR